MKAILLGSGTSGGVPRVGNDWGDCDPHEPRNRRSRVSLLIETEAGKRILVDTSPDLRNQLLEQEIGSLDAVIWTHDHADHSHGIDDLRPLFHRTRQPTAGYGRAYTAESLTRRFSYVFQGGDGYPPIVQMHELPDHLEIAGVMVSAVDQPHGSVQSTGLRFESDGKSIVYATDLSEITAPMVETYRDCDLLIVDCLREKPHPTHAHLAMSLDLAAASFAGRTILTHMDKSLDYRSLAARLPEGIEPGYDGLTVSL